MTENKFLQLAVSSILSSKNMPISIPEYIILPIPNTETKNKKKEAQPEPKAVSK